MILPDFHIERLCLEQRLVEPFIAANVQPSSIDVRLGNDFRVFKHNAVPYIDMADPEDITKPVRVDDDHYFMLHPGEFVLGVTKEEVRIPPNLVARIDGKSSLGRLGLIVHATAGFIDPGFHGNITLEMTCLHPLPIKLRPNFLIAQISFHQMPAPADRPYQGRYQGDMGAVPSRYGL